jgi:hypothetical protein
MQRKNNNKTASKRELKSREIGTLEQERDDYIERKLRIEKEIGTIYPEEANGRLKGMRLQAQADGMQEHIGRLYEKIAKTLLESAEIEKQAKLVKREYYITATGNRHLKAESRKAEISRTLKELAPSRTDGNTNVEKLCAAMETEYQEIDRRCKVELHNFASRYIELMGLPVDSNGDEPETLEEPTLPYYVQGQGRPRNSRRYPGALDASG